MTAPRDRRKMTGLQKRCCDQKAKGSAAREEYRRARELAVRPTAEQRLAQRLEVSRQSKRRVREKKVNAAHTATLDKAYDDGFLTVSGPYDELLDRRFYRMAAAVDRPYAVLQEHGKRADLLVDLISHKHETWFTEEGQEEASWLFDAVSRQLNRHVGSVAVQIFNVPAAQAAELMKNLLRLPTATFFGCTPWAA